MFTPSNFSRNKTFFKRLFHLLCLFFLCSHTLVTHAQRVALLIGNYSYKAEPLRNPPNDVREMESALTFIGFKVQKVLNANQNQMKRYVRDFSTMAKGAEVAFVYYSGAGLRPVAKTICCLLAQP